SVPLNPAGRRAADGWDPARAAENGCKPFGAAAIMRVPGRLHVTWDGETVLKIETDAGRQIRRLRFDTSQPDSAERSWQGFSVARWEFGAGGARGQGDAFVLQASRPHRGSLKVITTNMRAGYYRANGVPYSQNAVLTEYFDRHRTFDSE